MTMTGRIVRSLIVGATAMLLIGAAGATADEKPHKEKHKVNHKEQKEVEDKDLGIRKDSLYDEEKIKPPHGEYGKAEPGKSKRIQRAFENSPPLIPHDLTGMLPIAETNNACLNCHMPDTARAMNATPLPKSHFVDMDTGRDLKGNLDGKRYGCMQCHVPQVNIPEPIKNTFKADFRSAKMKTSSSLLESLNEGIKPEEQPEEKK